MGDSGATDESGCDTRIQRSFATRSEPPPLIWHFPPALDNNCKAMDSNNASSSDQHVKKG